MILITNMTSFGQHYFTILYIISKSADLYQCGDKISWVHTGYSDVTGKIFKKTKSK